MSIFEQVKLADVYMTSNFVKRSTPHEFKAGDKVWLSTEHLHLGNQPSRKFKQRFIGPYTITTKVSSNAYQLQLPDTMKCHDVFHISILQPCDSSTTQPDFIPTTIETARDEHIVDHIVEHKISEPKDGFYSRGPVLVFKVRWYGYTSTTDDTWETY